MFHTSSIVAVWPSGTNIKYTVSDGSKLPCYPKHFNVAPIIYRNLMHCLTFVHPSSGGFLRRHDLPGSPPQDLMTGQRFQLESCNLEQECYRAGIFSVLKYSLWHMIIADNRPLAQGCRSRVRLLVPTPNWIDKALISY